MVLRFGLERRFHLSGWGTVSSMSARHCYSGFCETALAGILRGRGIRQLIVTGCTTSVCVESTVRDAMFRNDPCCVLSDCTGEPLDSGNSRSNHEASLLNRQLVCGWDVESAHFVNAISNQDLLPSVRFSAGETQCFWPARSSSGRCEMVPPLCHSPPNTNQSLRNSN